MKKDKKTRKESPDKRIKQLESQLEENINTIKRLQADFENYIKRAEKEKTQSEIKIKQNLFLEMLNIVDAFDEALKSLKTDETTKKGIGGIYNQLIKFLEQHGVQKIESENKKLDPFKHEVIKQEESDKEENTILKEIQKGYLFHNDVLRPSKVITSNKAEVKQIYNSEEKKNE